MSQVYNTTGAPKLCLIFRDNPRVRIQPLRDAFAEMQFQWLETNVGNGENARDVLNYFEALASDRAYEGCCCLVVAMVGCYNAMDSWGINISGLDLDFDRLLRPFSNSAMWHGKPKLFIVQYENEAAMLNSTVCCDAALLAAGDAAAASTAASNGLPAFVDTALVFGYGGNDFNSLLCETLTRFGSRLEFHQLMTMLNRRARLHPLDPDLAPMAVAYASHLTKKFFFAHL